MPDQGKEKKKAVVKKTVAKKTTGKTTTKMSASKTAAKAKTTATKPKSAAAKTTTKKTTAPKKKSASTAKPKAAAGATKKKVGAPVKKSSAEAIKAATATKKSDSATKKKAASEKKTSSTKKKTTAEKKAAPEKKKTAAAGKAKSATKKTAAKPAAKKATAAKKKTAGPAKKSSAAKKSVAKKTSARKKGEIPLEDVGKPTASEAAASQTAFAPFRRHEPFEPTPEIPYGYGENELVLMARDPEWAYAYWEITGDTFENARNRHGRDIEGASMVLRVYDVTDIADGRGENGFYDISIFGGARDWFIHLQRPSGRYYCEIGLLTIGGRFIGLLKSNTISLPPRTASSVVDEQWMSGEEAFSRIFQLSGGLAEKTGSSFSERSYRMNVTEMLFSGTLQSAKTDD